MRSDQRLPVLIFTVLVALIAAPLIIQHVRDSRRPLLAAAVVVTATDGDPVFRSGRRVAEAGETVRLAVALRLTQTGQDDQWLAPVEQLEIEGQLVNHIQRETWIESDRHLRVFWFSVESALLGGRLTAEAAADRLRYRSFLAPEMGRGLAAASLPNRHNDDHLGSTGDAESSPFGTWRAYARVELVEDQGDVQPLQSVATAGPDNSLAPGFPTVSRGGRFPQGITSAAGELFNLPGFEPAPTDGPWNAVTERGFDRTFSDLVDARFVVSSWTFASVAVSGRSTLKPEQLVDLGPIDRTADELLRNGSRLRWPSDVAAGHLLKSGERWLVVLADDGNGELDPADSVLATWGHPPRQTTLLMALAPEATEVAHFRYDR
jgi:hypothetical protein